jgi:hypothetical protein
MSFAAGRSAALHLVIAEAIDQIVGGPTFEALTERGLGTRCLRMGTFWHDVVASESGTGEDRESRDGGDHEFHRHGKSPFAVADMKTARVTPLFRFGRHHCVRVW